MIDESTSWTWPAAMVLEESANWIWSDVPIDAGDAISVIEVAIVDDLT